MVAGAEGSEMTIGGFGKTRLEYRSYRSVMAVKLESTT